MVLQNTLLLTLLLVTISVCWANPRIINGNPANPGQFPYQAAINTSSDLLQRITVCSGSLIDPEWILTSASCIEMALDDKSVTMRVTLGSVHLSPDPDQVIVETNRYYIHEEYDRGSRINDIALLKIPKVQLTVLVNDVNLPPETYAGGNVVLQAGWGLTSTGSGLSDTLQWIQLTTVSYNDCVQDYVFVSPDEMICAKYDLGAPGGGPCDGDVGSALVLATESGVFQQIGIVSFGTPGCDSEVPSVFTRVSGYVDGWISGIINQ